MAVFALWIQTHRYQPPEKTTIIFAFRQAIRGPDGLTHEAKNILIKVPLAGFVRGGFLPYFYHQSEFRAYFPQEHKTGDLRGFSGPRLAKRNPIQAYLLCCPARDTRVPDPAGNAFILPSESLSLHSPFHHVQHIRNTGQGNTRHTGQKKVR
jgi:hypothetical protein